MRNFQALLKRKKPIHQNGIWAQYYTLIKFVQNKFLAEAQRRKTYFDARRFMKNKSAKPGKSMGKIYTVCSINMLFTLSSEKQLFFSRWHRLPGS